MAKVSVIIPVYNVDKYLQACLDSVVNQTFKDIEIICVNDGSTDNSLQILEEYAQKDNRIRIINQENKGLSGARNTGISYVTSPYIYFLDSDDYIEPNLCEKVVKIFENNDIDYVCFGSKIFRENDDLVQDINSMQRYIDIKFEGIQKATFDVGLNQNIHVWNKAFKTSIVKENNIRFIEGLLYEDIYFTWYYFFLSHKIYFEKDILHHYRVRSDSIMEKYTRNKSFESAMPHLYNWHELMLSISKDKDLFRRNIQNLKTLLKNYRKRTTQMCPKSDKKRVKLIAKQYDKELNRLIISELGFLFLVKHIFSQLFYTKQENSKIIICCLGLKLKINTKKISLKNLLKNIFSITNNENHKKITFCFCSININKKYFYRLIYFFSPIIKNKIVLCNFMGKSYGCNPKYITEEIIKQKLPYDIVWLVRNKNTETEIQYPKNIRLVEYDSKEAIKELFTAKLWVDNTRRGSLYKKGLFKRSNQKYIQTWHGSLGIKKVEASVEDVLSSNYVKYAKIDSKYIDYMLSNSLYDDRMFNDFWYNGKILRTGHPRCDIFFSKDEDKCNITNKVKEKLGIDKNKQILLYVPSFRDNYKLDAYNIDIDNILQTTKNKFGGEWVFAIRLHPNLSQKAQSHFKYDENIINATLYSDVLELLLSSDIVITDYSSCIFDFIFTKKPAFIYASDLDKYNNDRGFYYPLEDTPFSIATTNKQLIYNIANFDYKEYLANVDRFLRKQDCVEDGHSSERAVELIKSIMGSK